MKVKYQIFVSSTYEDLKAERDIVIKAILEMGHIPVGMEMFSAGDEQQWELIKRQIDDCDYYVVILAHRYGSTDGSIGYTEKEYDYAVSKHIPALGFVIHDDARWPKSKMDPDSVAQLALADFKEKVKRKIVDFWKTSEDLHAKVAVSLSKASTAYPRPGWIRATSGVGPDVMNELSRLSRENSELRATITSTEAQRIVDTKDEQSRISAVLQNNKVTISLRFKEIPEWFDAGKVSLFHIFNLLAPELFVEKSVRDMARYLGVLLRDADFMPSNHLRSEFPIPSNNLRTWLADFLTLGLIKPSPKKHQVKDTNEYWCISEFGTALYSRMREALLLSAGEEGPKEEPDQGVEEEPENAPEANIAPR